MSQPNRENERRRSLRSYVLGVKAPADADAFLGTAFLIGRGRDNATYAGTSYHVIQDHGRVLLRFKPTEAPGTTIDAVVVGSACDPEIDLAVLRLSDPVPAELGRLRLEYWKQRCEEFESYGFADETSGVAIEGRIDALVEPSKAIKSIVSRGDVLQLSVRNLGHGHSGAPVVLKGTDIVVGMICCNYTTTDDNPLQDIAWGQLCDKIIGRWYSAGFAPPIKRRSDWINAVGLALDPFASLDGASDKHIPSYYWPGPGYEDISGFPQQPGVKIVFGGERCGKSSLRNNLAAQYRGWRDLSVCYSPLAGDKQVSAEDAVREVIVAALEVIIGDLKNGVVQIDIKEENQQLRNSIATLAGKLIEDSAQIAWFNTRLGADLSHEVNDLPSSVRGLLLRFCRQACELFDYNAVVVLVDPYGGKSDQIWNSIEPLLVDEALLRYDDDRIGFRFILPLTLQDRVLAIEWIRSKRRQFVDEKILSWNPDSLLEMMRYRLYCSKQDGVELSSLADLADKVPDLDEIAISNSDSTPYGVIEFGTMLFDKRCEAPVDRRSMLISRQMVEDVVSELAMRRAETEMEQLISRDESATLEFKSTLRVNLHTLKKDTEMEHEVARTICGFLNSNQGGTLLIGVGDNREPIGLDLDLQTLGRRPTQEQFENAFGDVLKRLNPDPSPFLKCGFARYREKLIYHVDVKAGSEPTYFQVQDRQTLFYVRQGPRTNLLDATETVKHVLQRFPAYCSAQIALFQSNAAS